MTRDQLLADLRRALEPQIADEMEAWIPSHDRGRPYGTAPMRTHDLWLAVSEAVRVAFPDRASRIMSALHARAGFYMSLAETIWWCSLLYDDRQPATSVRSRGLVCWPEGEVASDGFMNASHDERVRMMSELIEKRRSLIKDGLLPRGALARGRLLLWIPDLSTTDGAPPIESRGFFDLNDAPPWDTWVSITGREEAGLVYSHVLAWVPANAIEHAELGIQVAVTEQLRFFGSGPNDFHDAPPGVWKLDP